LQKIDRSRLSGLSIALGLAGLALATGLIGWFGLGRIAHAVLSVGPGGFAIVCGWQVALFVALGLAWFVLRAPGQGWRSYTLVWGRMVRDAAANCLPFSLIGGFVLGARAVMLLGTGWRVATASTVVDLTTEFLAQIGFVVIGVGLLAARSPASQAILPVSLGLFAAIAAAAILLWLQYRGGGAALMMSRRVLGSWGIRAENQVTAVQRELTSIYAAPWRVALSTFLHLLAWLGTGLASWLAFRLLGGHITFLQALGIEALLHAVLALAILVPGYAGVQEAAYAAVGALFGQPAELSLGVSLLRRSRDIALGVPVLLVWQGMEWQRRRLATARLASARLAAAGRPPA
jgi:putative membrane protein